MNIIKVQHDVRKEYLRELGPRRFQLLRTVHIVLHTYDCGVLRLTIKAGFIFDGRSGGRGVDWLIPNLGTDDEIACWLAHDALFYAISLSFDTTNKILRQMLRLAGYPRWKASLVHASVSKFGSSHFGANTPEEKLMADFLDLKWDAR